MRTPLPIHTAFPTGGINKHSGFYNQPPGTTPDCMNVWPQEWATGSGRFRGGTRPGLDAVGSSTPETPNNWCNSVFYGPGRFTSSSTFGVGVAVSTTNGVYWSADGRSWGTRLLSNTNSRKFSDCAMFQNVVILCDGVAANRPVQWRDLGGNPDFSRNSGTLAQSPIPLPDTSVASTPPTGCGLATIAFDRLILAMDFANPHALYGSRSGHIWDFDITARDSGSAFDSSGLESGHIGEPPTSLIYHSKDCLIVGCTDSLYSMLGDPMAGGQVARLSPTVGPLMQSAWCKTDSEHTFLMAREGLYKIDPGCANSPPVNVTRGLLPDELMGLDPTSNKISLGYDGRFGGIHIFVNPDSGSPISYFYTWPTSEHPQGAFFPQEFDVGGVDLCLNIRSTLTNEQTGLVVLADGDSLSFNRTASLESVASFVWLGPLDLGDALTEGILTEMSIVLSENSDPLKYELYAGASAQEAFRGGVKYSGTWRRTKFNYKCRPRTRGVAAWLKLIGDPGDQWSIEDVVGKAYGLASRRVFSDAS